MRILSRTLLAALAVVTCAVSIPTAGAADDVPPSVVRTIPAHGDRAVDPALSELSVTFNERMRDGNWSWVYENTESFPEMLGQPRYLEGLTTNVLPVRLEPNKDYVVWVNSAQFSNFRDEAGNSAVPFRLMFRTGPGDE